VGISIIRADGSTTLSFDGVITYSLARSVTTTDHPIEDGSTITDHAQRQPAILGVRAVVTETPWVHVSSSGGAARVSAALDFLDAAAAERLTVVTDRYGTLENMLLTRYPSTEEGAGKLEWDLEFREIKIATAGLVEVPPDVPAADTSAGAGLPDAQDVGEQPTTSTETDPEQEAADKSLLLNLLESVGAEP